MPDGRVIQTYFSAKPPYKAQWQIIIITGSLMLSATLGPNGLALVPDLSASMNLIKEGQVWRLLTMLFVHRDLAHLGGNLFVLLPFTYSLLSYFQKRQIYALALVSGMSANYLTLLRLPGQTQLLGISGLSYWAAGAWLTLFILIDTRKSLRRRISYAIFISGMLLVPEKFSPDISYINHFWGLLFGVLCGLAIYKRNRQVIRAAEIYQKDEVEGEMPV